MIWIGNTLIPFGLPDGVNDAVPRAINNNNVVVGNMFLSGFAGLEAIRAFIWDGGTIRAISAIPDGRSSARDINDSGDIVGVVQIDGHPKFFVILDGKIKYLTGCAHIADPFAINNAGQVVGLFGYLWWNDECVQIPQIYPPGSGESPKDINDFGVIVGGGNSATAALWIDGEMYDLATLVNNMPDNYRLHSATSINNAGQIVGRAYLVPSNGEDRGFFLDPVTPDLTKDGVVDSADLLRLLSAYGSDDPHTDLDDSGVIDGRDLLRVLNDWGPVPVRDPREAFEMFKRTAERQAAERKEAARGPDLDAIDRATRPFAPRDR